MWSYFVFKNIMYHIRNGHLLRWTAAKSTSYVRNLYLFRACILWNSLSENVKYSESILDLKKEMRDLENIDFLGIFCQWIVQRIKVVTSHGWIKLFWCQCSMLNCIWLSYWYHFSACFQRIHFYHIHRDDWLVFIGFSYCRVPEIKLLHQNKLSGKN